LGENENRAQIIVLTTLLSPNSYSQLNNPTQRSMSMEEYTREFKNLLIKCDIQEFEDQTTVRYLEGLNPKYSNMVELRKYLTFDKVLS